MHQRARGFTLVEMLVSIGILSVVTAFATANFRAGRQGDELRIAANLAMTAARRAQTMAIAGQTVSVCAGGADDGKLCGAGNCASGTCSATVPIAYGVRFSSVSGSSAQTIVFADIDGDKRYDVGEAVRTEPLAPTPSVSVSVVAPSDAGSLDIAFEPPKPRVWCNGDTASAEAVITLRHNVTGMTKAISINAVSGRIGEQ